MRAEERTARTRAAGAAGSLPSPLRNLRALADPLLEVSVDSPEILDDLDTPEDLARLRARL